MKIALYYPWVYLKGGGERLILELVKRSRHEWTVFTNYFDRENTFPGFQQFSVVELKSISVKRTVAEVLKAAFTLSRQKLPSGNFAARCVVIDSIGSFVNFANRDLPSLAICLTPLRAVYDSLYWENYVSKNGSQKTLSILEVGKQIFKHLDRQAWSFYKKVFCISHEVKRRVEKGRLINPSKLEVAWPGIDLDFYKPSFGEPQKYFLLPGRIMWTKNIETGIEAFRIFYRSHENFKLIIAGIVDEKSKPYYEKLKQRAAGLPIQFLTDVSDSDMLRLYQESFGVLFTPFNEDWGFIPLEAMACGRPCISSKRGGPLESVVDGESGLLVEPDANQFAQAMKKLADDETLWNKLVHFGLQRVRRFTWLNFVDKIDCYLDSGFEKENHR